jgi:hypothetical protein
MPISVEQLWRRADCELPSLGTVRLKDVSIATIKAALEAAETPAEADQPETFTNQVLAAMTEEPKLDAAAVAALSEEEAAMLVSCAVGLLGVRSEFDALDAALPSRERLFRAHTQYYEAVSERLLSAFRPAIPNMFGLLYENKIADSLKGFISLNARASELAKSMQLMSGLNLKLLQPELPTGFLNLSKQLNDFGDLAASIQGISASPLAELAERLVATRLPEPFLSDALLSTGLNSPLIHTPTYPLPIIESMETEEDVSRRADEAERRRVLDAYDTLHALETRLRELIGVKLSEVRGNAWWRQSVPKSVRDDCVKRKAERETPDARSHHPIAYSYLGDLKDIILKGDNWDPVFLAIFESKTTFEAMFIWLEPVRKDVAHSRISSDDDYQYFTVAANGLHRAINRVLA